MNPFDCHCGGSTQIKRTWSQVKFLPVSVHRVSPRVRILSALGVILLLFVLTTALVKVDVSKHQREFFAGTLATVAVVSGASNLFTGSVFGISGLFPMRISQALISGTVSLADCEFSYRYVINAQVWVRHIRVSTQTVPFGGESNKESNFVFIGHQHYYGMS